MFEDFRVYRPRLFALSWLLLLFMQTAGFWAAAFLGLSLCWLALPLAALAVCANSRLFYGLAYALHFWGSAPQTAPKGLRSRLPARSAPYCMPLAHGALKEGGCAKEGGSPPSRKTVWEKKAACIMEKAAWRLCGRLLFIPLWGSALPSPCRNAAEQIKLASRLILGTNRKALISHCINWCG